MNEIPKIERWTAAEDMTLLTMWAEGSSVMDISRAVGKSYKATQTRANRKGCGRSGIPVKRARWSGEDNAKLLELRKLGQSAQEIATVLGRTEHAVATQICRLGIGTPERPAHTANSERQKQNGNRSRYEATDAAASKRKIRVCLTCQKPFMSEWKGNRRCDPCKKRTASDGMDD